MNDEHVRNWVEAQCKLVLFAVINALGTTISDRMEVGDTFDRTP